MDTKNEVAVLVLENPFWPPADDARSCSVRHFLEAQARYSDHMTVFYSTFFDGPGAIKALGMYLTQTKQQRQILYIAGHGGGSRLAGTNFKTVAEKIKENSPSGSGSSEGVMPASCFVGAQVEPIKSMLRGSSIAWVYGYTCAVDWVDTALIDLKLISILSSRACVGDLTSEEKLLDAFAQGLGLFSSQHAVGTRVVKDELGKQKEVPVALEDAFSVVLQPRRQGKRPAVRTGAVRQRLAWNVTTEE